MVSLLSAALHIGTGIRLASAVALILDIATGYITGANNGPGIGAYISQESTGSNDLTADPWRRPSGGAPRPGPRPAADHAAAEASLRWHHVRLGRPNELAAAELWVWRWVVLVAGVAAWQLWTSAARSSFFPKPLGDRGPHVPPVVLGTRLARVPDGGRDREHPAEPRASSPRLVIAAVIGVPLGIALGRSPAVTSYPSPLLQFARALPVVTMAPVFFALFSSAPRWRSPRSSSARSGRSC